MTLFVLATAIAVPSAAALRTNVVERSYDRFGRLVVLSVDGERRAEIAYDGATGRIASMRVAGEDEPFRWEYEPGCDLKRTLRYPNGAKVTWEYEPHRDFVTLVSNDVYSAYRYEYDAAGRRVSKNDERYEYNERGELTLATNAVMGTSFAYCYDDIGNRLWSRELGTNCVYAANELNQYTNVVRGGVSEQTAFDLDGNQTNIVTSTGEWSVEYNGENRPVRWTCAFDGATVLMAYDRMGRRVRKNGETFVYDGYLNVSQTVWDPTEPVATRPLVWLDGGEDSYYVHDGNKNVVGSVSGVQRNGGLTTLDYAPFGALLTAQETTPWQFSSECFDFALGLYYFNHRHYDCFHGRWIARDPFEEIYPDVWVARIDGYAFVSNDPIRSPDLRGLDNPGCDIVGAIPGWETDCRLRCCARHDECYDKNGCSAWSWLNPLIPFKCPSKCDECNDKVVLCTVLCFTGHDPGRPPWEPPKPGDGKYYCAKKQAYVADPEECR